MAVMIPKFKKFVMPNALWNLIYGPPVNPTAAAQPTFTPKVIPDPFAKKVIPDPFAKKVIPSVFHKCKEDDNGKPYGNHPNA